jgi:hypothetical protein
MPDGNNPGGVGRLGALWVFTGDTYIRDHKKCADCPGFIDGFIDCDDSDDSAQDVCDSDLEIENP